MKAPHALRFRRSVGNDDPAPGRVAMAEKRQRPTRGRTFEFYSLAVEDGGFLVHVARVGLRCSRFLSLAFGGCLKRPLELDVTVTIDGVKPKVK